MSSGYDFHWFADASSAEDLMCEICRDVLKEPLQCKNGHVFCEFCITKNVVEYCNKCPKCKLFIFMRRIKPSDENQRKVNELTVKCNCCFPKKVDGDVCLTWSQFKLKDCGDNYNGGIHCNRTTPNKKTGGSVHSLRVRQRCSGVLNL